MKKRFRKRPASGERTSFRCALRGITLALRGERSIWIHLAAAYYVLVSGLIVGLGRGEWVAVTLCIALVLALEMANTAIERLCDAFHPDWNEKIRAVKDIAAGFVLIAAAGSAVAGGLIFFTRARVGAMLRLMARTPFLSALLAFAPFLIYLIVRALSNAGKPGSMGSGDESDGQEARRRKDERRK